jgi:hypothetical protein
MMNPYHFPNDEPVPILGFLPIGKSVPIFGSRRGVKNGIDNERTPGHREMPAHD